MAGGVGLDAILPVDSSALWYPLSMLRPDPHTRKMKKLDRQRLLTIGYYNLYRHAARYLFLQYVDLPLILFYSFVWFICDMSLAEYFQSKNTHTHTCTFSFAHTALPGLFRSKILFVFVSNYFVVVLQRGFAGLPGRHADHRKWARNGFEPQLPGGRGT